MPKLNGSGLQGNGKDLINESPFSIYHNALLFVMNSLAVDEDAAVEVILNELHGYADDWLKVGVRSVADEIKAKRMSPYKIKWERAWLN